MATRGCRDTVVGGNHGDLRCPQCRAGFDERFTGTAIAATAVNELPLPGLMIDRDRELRSIAPGLFYRNHRIAALGHHRAGHDLNACIVLIHRDRCHAGCLHACHGEAASAVREIVEADSHTVHRYPVEGGLVTLGDDGFAQDGTANAIDRP